MSTKTMAVPKTIDAYLAGVPPKQRAALQRLRKVIRKAAPDAEECISYQLPTFKQDGMLVAFGAWKEHCAIYALSSRFRVGLERELAGYETSAGTIRFRPDAPLSDALVRELVARRLAENRARVAKRSPKPASTKRPSRAQSGSDGDATVFFDELVHPEKRAIESVRKAIRSVSPSIREEIKWNSPSFATREHFATFHLRAKRGFQLVLHRGATAKAPKRRLEVPDPAGLLAWRGTDRAVVTFADARDVAKKLPALKSVLRAWIRHVAPPERAR